MQQESFATLPLQQIIPSYLYQEYAQDDDLQAFVDSQNSIAQGYHDWFLQNPLGLYTAPGISGQLLDWVALGVYGIPRPTLASQSTIITAGYDSTAYDTVPYNFLSYSASGSAEQTTDDIFKRILTWNLYRGDGQVFTLQWLKNRIARFLHGPFGADCPVLNFQPSITISGTTFTVTDFATANYTTLQLCMDAYALAFPFQYTLVFAAESFTNVSGVLTLATPLYYPTSVTGLAPGSVWDSAGSIKVVPGITPDPNAPSVYFGQIDPVLLLTIGGGNLPTSNLFSVTNQPFGTGNGTATAFQLSINGFPISSYTGTPQIFRADWQGNQLLYTTARTNLCPGSQTIGGTQWSLTSATATQNNVTAADGTTTAATLTSTASATGRAQSASLSTTASANYEASVYFSAGTSAQSKLSVYNSGVTTQIAAQIVNWSGGVASLGTSSGLSNPVLTAMPHGMYRLSYTVNVGANTSIRMLVYPDLSGGSGTVNAWGAQFELGSAATSYISTTTAAVTTTDYTLSGSGAVTTAVAPLTNASMTWTGTGVPHGSNQLWNNSGVVSIL